MMTPSTMRVGRFPRPRRAARRLALLAAATATGLVAGALPALAQGARPAPAPQAAPNAGRSDAETFCASVIDPAAEARFAWQANTLKSLEDKLADALARLEERKAEIEALVAEREAEAERAETRMVSIFSRMRPDAAASQLAAMDQQLAASLLAKLAPRAASAVLNEMEAARAAQLAEAIGGKRPKPDKTGAQNP